MMSSERERVWMGRSFKQAICYRGTLNAVHGRCDGRQDLAGEGAPALPPVRLLQLDGGKEANRGGL